MKVNEIRVLHIHCWSHRPMVYKPRAEVHPNHQHNYASLIHWPKLSKTNHTKTIKMDSFKVGWSNKDFQCANHLLFNCSKLSVLKTLTCSHGLFRRRTMHYFIALGGTLVNGNGETWPSICEHYGALDHSRWLHPFGKGPLDQKECSQV